MISHWTLFLLLVCFTQSIEVYVSVNGSDTNPGTPSLPVKTFTKALSFSISDLHLKVSPGSYENSEIVVENRTNIIIESISSKVDTKLFKVNSAELLVERNLVFIKNSHNVTIKGFSMDGETEMSSLGSLVKIEKSSNVTIVDSVLQKNKAKKGSAIYISESFRVNLKSLLILNNTAVRHDLVLQNYFTNNKRSIFNVSEVFMGSNTPYFISDSSTTGFGTIFIESSISIKLIDSKVLNNFAKSGGAIFLQTANGIQNRLDVENSYFEQNSVSTQGSVLYGDANSNFTFQKSTFISNSCQDWKCKIVYSESWKKSDFTIFEVWGTSSLTGDLIILLVQAISVGIVGLVVLDSIALGLFLLFREIYLYVKVQKKGEKNDEIPEGSKNEEIKDENDTKTPNMDENDEIPEGSNEEKNEKNEETIDENKTKTPNNKKGFMKKFRERQKEKLLNFDNGVLPTFIAFMFSTVTNDLFHYLDWFVLSKSNSKTLEVVPQFIIICESLFIGFNLYSNQFNIP
jgi:hypothetical protein